MRPFASPCLSVRPSAVLIKQLRHWYYKVSLKFIDTFKLWLKSKEKMANFTWRSTHVSARISLHLSSPNIWTLSVEMWWAIYVQNLGTQIFMTLLAYYATSVIVQIIQKHVRIRQNSYATRRFRSLSSLAPRGSRKAGECNSDWIPLSKSVFAWLNWIYKTSKTRSSQGSNRTVIQQKNEK
jgi:hypothetical protein